MKKFIPLIYAALIVAGCSSAAQQITPNTNGIVQTSNAAPQNLAVVSSHSSEDVKVAQPEKNSSTESSPMARPVDVSELTAEIEKAEKNFKKNPPAKGALGNAYFKRAFALTEAAQYRAALGDFRKGLKLNPNDDDAKAMHDKILEIFKSINREPPKEGEEPPPLPFKN